VDCYQAVEMLLPKQSSDFQTKKN